MSQRWVILLAGGEGTRVRALTRDTMGSPAPKQFCRLHGDRTLLRAALDRAHALTRGAYIVPVVQAAHRRWWEGELLELPQENVLEESVNRGTAVAILRALQHIRSRDPAAVVVLLPSDHGAEDEEVLLETIDRAAAAATEWPRHAILVGMEPEQVESDYGWIQPESPCRSETAGVEGFYEKPDMNEACRLVGAGALINTFIVAATAPALHRMYLMTLPELTRAAAIAIGSGDLPSRDFSRDLLERSARRLRVLRGRSCGWSDLGTPERLNAWLSVAAVNSSRGGPHELAHT